MRILIISAQPPAPFSGGEIRLLNLVKPLSVGHSDRGKATKTGGHEFTVIAPVRDLKNPSVSYALTEASKYCRFIPVMVPPATHRSYTYYLVNGWWRALTDPKPHLARSFYSPVFKQAIDELIKNEQFDLIQAQQFLTAQYVSQYVTLPKVMDVDNLWSTLLPRQEALNSSQRVTRKAQTQLDRRKIKPYETANLRRFDACLAVTEQDAAIIQRLAPGSRTTVIPNGVDCNFFQPDDGQIVKPGRLLFVGTLSWQPNVDAVAWFGREIFPLIREKHPEAIFQIVGREPAPEVLGLAEISGIEVTGFVEDIRPALAACQVFVVPLRAGAGTRLKILEALAMSKSVVSTSIGAEGLLAESGEHLLISDDPLQFADCVAQLLDQPLLAARLGHNGRRLVAENYDWNAIAEKLNEVYLGLGA